MHVKYCLPNALKKKNILGILYYYNIGNKLIK